MSDKGETITRLSDTMSVSSTGVSYTKMGNMTVGSDGSNFTQMGDFSTDGSVRMGSTTTGASPKQAVLSLQAGLMP